MNKAYKQICEALGIKPITRAAFDKLAPQEIKNTVLVAIPNVPITREQLYKLARSFGEDQPYETYIYNDLYDLYTTEELVGKVTDNKVRFLHIQSELDSDLSNKTTDEQVKLNKNHVPTVYEAVCFWFTLRALNKPLNFNSTYIRHFDLPERRFDGVGLVPFSDVSDDGKPNLNDSNARYDFVARVSVGKNLNLKPSLETSSSTDLQENTEAIKELTKVINRYIKEMENC